MIRYCKKCKCELSEDTKGKLCDNCRKKRNTFWRHVGEGAIGTVVAAATIFFGSNSKRGGSSSKEG